MVTYTRPSQAAFQQERGRASLPPTPERLMTADGFWGRKSVCLPEGRSPWYTDQLITYIHGYTAVQIKTWWF